MRKKRRRDARWVMVACALVCACSTPEDAATFDASSTQPRALVGLSAEEQRGFHEGFRDFVETETAAQGLGPLFNASSCAHCHNLGGTGGPGNLRVLRAVCREPDGVMFDPPGGTLIHLFSTRSDVIAANVPTDCDAVTTQRRTTNVLGAGLIDAIDDGEILAEAERQQNSVQGRVAWVDEPDFSVPRVGRFGWKAQHASLHAFAGDAYLNELGITNELFPDEVAPGGDRDVLALIDPAPDPEAAVGAVTNLASFMRFSAPLTPQRDEPDGYAVFMQIGCDDCHREHYTASGDSSLSGLDARLFSDLLLHDIDSGIDVPQGAATEREFRTAPLWGLGRSAVFLHDGRAGSLHDAIAAHGAQAAPARDAYLSLTEAEQGDLIAFLRSL